MRNTARLFVVCNTDPVLYTPYCPYLYCILTADYNNAAQPVFCIAVRTTYTYTAAELGTAKF